MSRPSCFRHLDVSETTESSLTPEGVKLLERLRQFERDDSTQQFRKDHKTRLRPRLSFETLPEHESLFLQEKYEYRKASAKLLKALILQSETRTIAPAIATQDQQLSQRNARARHQWLDRLERKFLVDKAFSDSASSQHSTYARWQRDQQIAIWKKENDSRQKRWLEALSVVLAFKAGLHAPKEARVASILNGIDSLPRELLLVVIETCVKPHLGQWSVQGSTDSTALSRIVDKCFNWPNILAANIHNLLKLEASKALIKTTIVKMPMVFSTLNTIILPPMLVDRYNRELNKSIKSIPVLGGSFPSPKVFVLSVYFHCDEGTDEHKQRFRKDALKIRNFRQAKTGPGWEFITIGDTVIERIATLARLQPRVRSMIRFGHALGGYDRQVGPLVTISNASAHAVEQSAVKDIDDEPIRMEDPSVSNARNIFTQAYHAPRAARGR